MKLPSWITSIYRRDPPSKASLSQCPKCGAEMRLIEKFSMSGDDMRTYRCDRCQKEHIVDFGTAMWKLMSDANKSKE
jgi:predicted RNA-binding Zn-ribbon protein involved in translation (DUF1610 family)